MTSRSNSPTSLALQVALHRHLSSSPNRMPTDYRGDEELVKHVCSENITDAVENESAATTLKVEVEEKNEDLAHNFDAHNIAITSGSCKVLKSPIDRSLTTVIIVRII